MTNKLIPKTDKGNMPSVEIFGLEALILVSCYQLSRINVRVQPYYITDYKYRHSIENELNAIKLITEDIINNLKQGSSWIRL